MIESMIYRSPYDYAREYAFNGIVYTSKPHNAIDVNFIAGRLDNDVRLPDVVCDGSVGKAKTS